MLDAVDVLGQALEDIWDNLFLGAACSLLWLGLTLLVLPAPGATVALFDMAQKIHARESPTIRDFWRLVWKHFWVGWRWVGIALPITLILWADFRIAPMILAGGLATAMRATALLALAVWFVMLAYSLPLLFRQERGSVLQALRNAGVMALQNPAYSLALLLVALLMLWVSMLLIVVNLLAGPVFCAFLATRAVDNRLRMWLAVHGRI